MGSGTSNGVPSLGYEYSESFLANPKNHRTRASLLLRGPKGNVLVDCAPEMRLQLLGAKVLDLEAVIITHTHADHIMGMDDLRSFYLRSRRPMKIYAGAEAQADIRRIFPYAFEEPAAGIEVPRFDLLDVPEEILEAGLVIKTMWVHHGPTPVVALRVNDFAYVTDVSEIPPPAWALLGRLDVLILDGVRIKPHPCHFHLERAIEIAQALGARQTYLTHLSHDYDHDQTNSELPNGIDLAFDGLTIAI